MPPYAHLGYGRGSFPVAEDLAEEVLSLPMFPGIDDDRSAVVDCDRRFLRRG